MKLLHDGPGRRLWGRACALLLGIAVLSTAACDSKRSQTAALAQKVFPKPVAAKLAQAAAIGDTARIDELVKSGADPNAIGDKQTSLLQWALLQQNPAGFDALLLAGANAAHADDAGETVMHYAARANDASYLDVLLAHAADPNTPNTISGATPLMEALMSNRNLQFHKLLAAGADPNVADHLGNTSLHVAAKIEPHALHVLELLEAGADPVARNKQGATFQRYVKLTPCDILAGGAKRERRAVAEWLPKHGVPVEDGLSCP